MRLIWSFAQVPPHVVPGFPLIQAEDVHRRVAEDPVPVPECCRRPTAPCRPPGCEGNTSRIVGRCRSRRDHWARARTGLSCSGIRDWVRCGRTGLDSSWNRPCIRRISRRQSPKPASGTNGWLAGRRSSLRSGLGGLRRRWYSVRRELPAATVDGQGPGENRKRGAEVRVPQEAETSLRIEFDDVVQGYVGETAAYPS